MSDDADEWYKEVKRSTGRGFLICAAVLAVVSAFSLIQSFLVQPYDPEADFNRLWWRFLSYSTGGVAVINSIVGSIVRAIWFLPGEDTKYIRRLRR